MLSPATWEKMYRQPLIWYDPTPTGDIHNPHHKWKQHGTIGNLWNWLRVSCSHVTYKVTAVKLNMVWLSYNRFIMHMLLSTLHITLLLFIPMYPSNFSTSWSSNFMCSLHVLIKSVFLCETSRAQRALKWFFSPVCHFMRFQVNLCLQHLATETALELGCLMTLQM